MRRIWQELLKVEQVGIHDNFFELGGHSLLAMKTLSVIKQNLGLEISVSDIFQNQTISEIAKFKVR